ncbi:RNA polymerase sigma factor [Zobellia alginiliquefaciens]|uniref:RNA polymerase sigma factor n=1 Tax=Zobellia alginiliquefaciens TaxID=3032586 RepID=UPI0023E448F9|nr:sigma-70 family RNA polymerase sigma factor [Zobellia alginiliquefaciens]
MSIKNLHDINLTEGLKSGNENAYAQLVKTYHKPLFTYALSLSNSEATAKDIVQTVFLKTWEYRKKLKPELSIKSFLYKTTYNEFINQYHKNRKLSILERTYMEALDEMVEDTHSELFERKIRLITEGISKLPKKCKQTFLLSKKDGLTNIEIAEYLNVSVRTVEWQLNKAYNLLRKQVGLKMENILFLIFSGKRKL